MKDTTVLVLVVVLVVAILAAAYIFVRKHFLGTFKFDNSGATYRCRFEFDDLDELEKLRFAIVKVKEENLSLPGEHISQH